MGASRCFDISLCGHPIGPTLVETLGQFVELLGRRTNETLIISTSRLSDISLIRQFHYFVEVMSCRSFESFVPQTARYLDISLVRHKCVEVMRCRTFESFVSQTAHLLDIPFVRHNNIIKKEIEGFLFTANTGYPHSLPGAYRLFGISWVRPRNPRLKS